MRATRLRQLGFLLMAGAILSTLVVSATPPRVFATSPCVPIQYDPDPPGGEEEPTIGGSILNAATPGGISGVTVKLYQCSGGAGVYQTSTTTDAQGAYEFTGLADEHWYYVEAALTGPLAGMTPASGTSNPTAAIGLGNNVSGVNLSFQ